MQNHMALIAMYNTSRRFIFILRNSHIVSYVIMVIFALHYLAIISISNVHEMENFASDIRMVRNCHIIFVSWRTCLSFLALSLIISEYSNVKFSFIIIIIIGIFIIHTNIDMLYDMKFNNHTFIYASATLCFICFVKRIKFR